MKVLKDHCSGMAEKKKGFQNILMPLRYWKQNAGLITASQLRNESYL